MGFRIELATHIDQVGSDLWLLGLDGERTFEAHEALGAEACSPETIWAAQRDAFDSLDKDLFDQYVALSLDDRWLAVVAWQLFREHSPTLQTAGTVVDGLSDDLLEWRANGATVEQAAGFLLRLIGAVELRPWIQAKHVPAWARPTGYGDLIPFVYVDNGECNMGSVK